MSTFQKNRRATRGRAFPRLCSSTHRRAHRPSPQRSPEPRHRAHYSVAPPSVPSAEAAHRSRRATVHVIRSYPSFASPRFRLRQCRPLSVAQPPSPRLFTGVSTSFTVSVPARSTPVAPCRQLGSVARSPNTAANQGAPPEAFGAIEAGAVPASPPSGHTLIGGLTRACSGLASLAADAGG
jgi:hypothetical protein